MASLCCRHTRFFRQFRKVLASMALSNLCPCICAFWNLVPFEAQKCTLCRYSGTEARQAAISADDAVTGNDDEEGVLPDGTTCCMCSLGTSNFARKVAVSYRPAEGDASECLPNFFLKRTATEIKR